MKILQVNNYYEIIGGSERVFRETINLLKDHKFEVNYFSTSKEISTEVESENGLLIPSMDFFKGNVASKIWNIHQFLYSKKIEKHFEKYLTEMNPDIIHVHIFYGQLTNAILKVAKRHNIPVVMSVHEYKMLCPTYTFIDGKGQICEKCQGSKFYQCILNKCNKKNLAYSTISAFESYYQRVFFSYIKNINHFIMVSQFIKKKHEEYIPEIAFKSSVLYNFINLDLFKFSELNSTNDFLYFGRFSKEKGIETLLNTFKKLPDLNLKLIGSGPLLETLINENIEYKNIQFLGYKHGAELHDYISNAKYVIIPSEWYENNPMTVIEAFALGTPVIGANIGGIPELVLHHSTGFLFESGSENDLKEKIIFSNLLHKSEYIQMRKNCRTFAETKLDKELHFNKLIHIYKSIIKRNPN